MKIEEAKKMMESKLECLVRDVSGQDDDCNNKRCYECPLNYEMGNMGEQKEWLRIAIELAMFEYDVLTEMSCFRHVSDGTTADYIFKIIQKYPRIKQEFAGMIGTFS